MSGCNEDAVRTLFAEHGGETLQAKDLMHVIDSYEKQCGSPVVAAPIALQVSAFASNNGELMVGVEEFLGMVRSLEQDADSSLETSVPSLLDTNEESPDTTLDMGPESPMKHKSAYASQARAQLDRTSAQGRLTSTKSDSDVAGFSVRSRLIRKLARVSDQLERLQNEHDSLTVDKEQSDSHRAALQRQVKTLQRELHTVREHAQHLEGQLHHLEETLTTLRHERASQACTIKALDARVNHFSHLQKEQEAGAAQQEVELESARTSCRAYLLQVQELQATCHAQRQSMGHLEATVSVLESAHMDAEKLQDEVDASRQVRERLEWELHELRQQTGESLSVLARDLDPLGEWTVAEVPREATTPTATNSPALAASMLTDALASKEAPGPATCESEAPTLSITEESSLSPLADGLPSARGQVIRGDGEHAEAQATSDVASPEALTTPRASARGAERWADRLMDILTQKASEESSAEPAAIHAGWFLLVHVLLLGVGIWLGLWLYHIVLKLSPQYVYQQLLDQRWADLNLLHDPLDTPLSTQLWLERHLSTLA